MGNSQNSPGPPRRAGDQNGGRTVRQPFFREERQGIAPHKFARANYPSELQPPQGLRIRKAQVAEKRVFSTLPARGQLMTPNSPAGMYYALITISPRIRGSVPQSTLNCTYRHLPLPLPETNQWKESYKAERRQRRLRNRYYQGGNRNDI